MRYETPTIIDHGSIAEHTFTRCGGSGPPKKDFPESEHKLDKFNECSGIS